MRSTKAKSVNYLSEFDYFVVELDDGNFAYFDKNFTELLKNATPEQLSNVQNKEDSFYWPDLNESLPLDKILPEW